MLAMVLMGSWHGCAGVRHGFDGVMDELKVRARVCNETGVSVKGNLEGLLFR